MIQRNTHLLTGGMILSLADGSGAGASIGQLDPDQGKLNRVPCSWFNSIPN